MDPCIIIWTGSGFNLVNFFFSSPARHCSSNWRQPNLRKTGRCMNTTGETRFRQSSVRLRLHAFLSFQLLKIYVDNWLITGRGPTACTSLPPPPPPQGPSRFHLSMLLPQRWYCFAFGPCFVTKLRAVKIRAELAVELSSVFNFPGS
jgi:hypothetical protein